MAAETTKAVLRLRTHHSKQLLRHFRLRLVLQLPFHNIRYTSCAFLPDKPRTEWLRPEPLWSTGC